MCEWLRTKQDHALNPCAGVMAPPSVGRRYGLREVDPMDLLGALQGGARRAERGPRQLVPCAWHGASERGGEWKPDLGRDSSRVPWGREFPRSRALFARGKASRLREKRKNKKKQPSRSSNTHHDPSLSFATRWGSGTDHRRKIRERGTSGSTHAPPAVDAQDHQVRRRIGAGVRRPAVAGGHPHRPEAVDRTERGRQVGRRPGSYGILGLGPARPKPWVTSQRHNAGALGVSARGSGAIEPRVVWGAQVVGGVGGQVPKASRRMAESRELEASSRSSFRLVFGQPCLAHT